MNIKPPQKMAERVTVAGGDLVGFVKRLIAEGNVRRLVIHTADGTPLMDIPLTAGVAVGGLVTVLAPLLTALAAIAALVSKVQVDIQRFEPGQRSDLDVKSSGNRSDPTA